MIMSQVLPESCYFFESLSLPQVEQALKQSRPITGRVEKIQSTTKELIVRLGDDVVAHLPFAEATLYPTQRVENSKIGLSVNFGMLINKIVRVKVTSIHEQEIYVSRKQNLEQTYNLLKTYNPVLVFSNNLN